MKRLWLFAGACVLLLVWSIPVAAVTLNYSVDGWGPTSFPGPVTPPAGSPHGSGGYPGDTVQLLGCSGSLNVTVTNLGETETFYNQKINTLCWSVDFTYAGTKDAWDYPAHWSDLAFDIDATRGMTMDGGGGSLSQAGLLEVTWSYDRLSFSQGSASFVVGSYLIEVTPLAVAPSEAGGTVGPPWVQPQQDVLADIKVTVVPEPVTMLGMFLGLGSVGAYIRRRIAR